MQNIYEVRDNIDPIDHNAARRASAAKDVVVLLMVSPTSNTSLCPFAAANLRNYACLVIASRE